jgi:hypothetical protein
MAFVVNDRVQEFTSTTGTGTLTLTGSPDGFETFSSAVGNGNTTYYTISSNTTEFEVGIGTVGAGTLSRDTVISSSNSDALVNFSAGTKNVFVTLPASKTILLNDSGTVDLTGNLDLNSNDITGTGNINITGNLTASGNLTSLGIDDNATSTAITINSSEQVEFTAGTALLPAITTTGDTNTGMWFPAADTIAFSEGGAEAMRIDSSGRVGIGTSSPTFLNTTGSASSKTIGLYNSGTATSQRAELQLGSAATASGNLTSGVLFGCGASDTTKNTLGSIFGIIDATSTTTASGALTFWTAATASGANTERMRIDSSGNVGIGTSSPDAKLSVNGVASFGDGTALLPSIANFGDLNTGMWFPAADTIAFSEGGAEAMRIDSSGRVGIGTSTPSEKLVVERSGAGNVVRFTDGTYGVDVAVTSTGGSLQTGNINQTLDFKVYGNGYMGFYTSGTSERMRILSGGNVGIGTTTPDSLLSVNGVASFGDGTALLPSIANFGDLNTGMWFPAADTIAFSEGGVEAMRIDSSGNVGIGTSTITGKLNIATATSDGVNTLFGANVSPTAAGMYVGFNDSDATATLGVYYASNPYPVINITRSDRTIKFMNDASERMRIDSSGNVGIGTSSPESLFHIESASSDPTLRITNKTVAAIDTGPDIEFWNNPFTATTVNSYESGAIRVRKTNGSNNNHDHYMSFWTRQNSPEGINERMRIDSSGNVFIAKTASSASTVGIQLEAQGVCVATSDGNLVYIANRLTDDGTLFSFRQAGTEEGTISVSGSTVSYNGFTGTHWSRFTDNSTPNILRGTVLESLDEMCDWYNLEFDVTTTTQDVTETHTKKIPYVLTGTQSNGDVITYNHEGTDVEATIVKENDVKHMMSKVSDTVDAKNVYGVFVAYDLDGEGYNDFYVASVGSFVVRIKANETIAKGDLLQSNGDGTAKVQTDDAVRSSSFAKVLSTTIIETYEDGSYLVPCSLMC